MKSSHLTLLILAVWCLARCASAQEETLYMAVLSSHAHLWNNPQNPMIGLFLSSDRGATWEHRGWREYVRTFYSEEASDGTIWSACGNGVMRSTDRGATWRVTTGWEVTEVLKVRSDPPNPARVVAATAYGIFRSTDHGETWEQKISGLGKPFTSDVWIDRTDGKRMLAATEHGVFVSTDGGDSWTPAGLKGKGIRCIVQDPLVVKRFWVGTEDDGLFLSEDGGRRWMPRSDGLNHRTVYSIWCDPAAQGVLYLGTHGGGVYGTTDGGKSWKQCATGLTTLDVHAVAGIPGSPDVLFAGTLNGGLFRSTDMGMTWEFNSQREGQVWGLSVGKAR